MLLFWSTITGFTPKRGLVAEPGLVEVTPGNGLIRIPPVSVCHQVSTISQFLLPTLKVLGKTWMFF